MLISVVQIGNSKGIRLPKSVLEQCRIGDQMDLEVSGNTIILTPVTRKPRAGWAERFSDMAEAGEDRLLIEDGLDLSESGWDW
jgi:antitoxin MazE